MAAVTFVAAGDGTRSEDCLAQQSISTLTEHLFDRTRRLNTRRELSRYVETETSQVRIRTRRVLDRLRKTVQLASKRLAQSSALISATTYRATGQLSINRRETGLGRASRNNGEENEGEGEQHLHTSARQQARPKCCLRIEEKKASVSVAVRSTMY